jgi:hypothetical protein
VSLRVSVTLGAMIVSLIVSVIVGGIIIGTFVIGLGFSLTQDVIPITTNKL